MDPRTAPAEEVVADYFHPFAITLPGLAALELPPGPLTARGWSIRWP